jgi:hypothetical protein
VHQRSKPSVAADHPSSSDRARRSCQTRRRADRIWSFSCKNIPFVEPKRAENDRMLWYCKQCPSYSVSSTSDTRAHMVAIHFTVVSKEEVRGVARAKQADIVKLLGQQQLKAEREALNSEKQVLRAAAKLEIVRAALYRLITCCNLPDDCVEWLELHTLVHSINYMATDVLPTSHSTVAAAIAEDFHIKQLQSREQLARAITPIHLTTDTWTSRMTLSSRRSMRITLEKTHNCTRLSLPLRSSKPAPVARRSPNM